MVDRPSRVYFSHPRLSLSGFGDLSFRLVSYSVYALLTAAAVLLFLTSDIPSLFWFSILLLMFLIDRLFHIRKGEKEISRLVGPEMNVAETLSPSALRLLNAAFRKALVTKHSIYLILLDELSDRRDVQEVLRRLSVDPKKFKEKVSKYVEESSEDLPKPEVKESLERITVEAFLTARKTGEKFVEVRNIFSGIAGSKDPRIMKILHLFEMDAQDVREAIVFGRFAKTLSGFRRVPAVLGGFAHKSRGLRKRTMNRAWTARPTPTLDRYSTDMTDLARAEKAGFLVGHETEYENLISVISRVGKPNALLVGEPGVGKSTIMAHLAFRMIKDDVPSVLFDKRLLSLDVGKLVADATQDILGGRIQEVVDEIILAGNIVLFIPSMHDLFRTAPQDGIHAIDLLLPIVKNENIPMIGETFPKEFKKYIEPRSDFLDQFEVVQVDEISEEEAVRFLVYLSILFEKQFKVFITFRAVRKAVELAHRYFHNRPLPGSAVDIMKQALAHARDERAKMLDGRHILEVAERQSRIPIRQATVAEAEKLLNLEDLIHERLVNQNTAVNAVSRALREYRSGLSRKGGPIATFLFVGPTGVGKTELAKILTDIHFGSKDFMHRFDMSEYQDKQSIFRFIGTPDGSRSGTLTDAILENPYSLILLDEFEKAHPDILNLFLQVFDDGRLTDSLGRTVDFENTIIIATSNAHSEYIKEEIEKGTEMERIAEDLKKKLTEYFRPELINRFSDIIAFRSLNPGEIEIITGFLLKDVEEVLGETHGIKLAADESAIRRIAQLGYSPVFGARPLRKVISEEVRSVLAEKILKKEIGRGNTVAIGTEGEGFTFSVTE